MTAIARLAAIAVDSADPAELATFYRQLLELEVIFESENFIALKGAGIALTVHGIPGYQPPDWPDGDAAKQLHLDLAVTDLDASEAAAVALGATKAAVQPSPDRWRVLLDPAGHPFCVTIMVPADL